MELRDSLPAAQSVVASLHCGSNQDMIEKVVSGGQTGVDRAALDAALKIGIGCGGWCPRDRRAEDGIIPKRYPLKQTKDSDYFERTRRNVEDANGTLIVAPGELNGGTLATLNYVQRIGKPFLIIDLDEPNRERHLTGIIEWLHVHRIKILNVAGPRESGRPGIYDDALDLIARLLVLTSSRRPS